MAALVSSTATYLLNALWQVPLLFASASLAARLAARRSPLLAHRLWAATLLLEVTLPACSFRPDRVFSVLWGLLVRSLGQEDAVRVAFGSALPVLPPLFARAPQLVSLLLTLYALVTLWYALRLLHGSLRVSCLVSVARTLDTLEKTPELRIVASSAVRSPTLIGIFRSILIVPPDFYAQLSRAERAALLAHEQAHARRQDVAWNLLFRIIELPIAFHPMLWLTRVRLSQTRELVCDQLAAAQLSDAPAYARTLLRMASLLATAGPVSSLHAIGLLDANTLERRITMLLNNPQPASRWRRTLATFACAGILLASSGTALALHVGVAPPQTGEASARQVRIPGGVAAGSILSKEAPVYPQEAKSSGSTLNGSVVLNLVIDEAGVPENITVAKSLREDYYQSALTAVAQWRWKPFLLNGQPTAVTTSVTITYSLNQ